MRLSVFLYAPFMRTCTLLSHCFLEFALTGTLVPSAPFLYAAARRAVRRPAASRMCSASSQQTLEAGVPMVRRKSRYEGDGVAFSADAHTTTVMTVASRNVQGTVMCAPRPPTCCCVRCTRRGNNGQGGSQGGRAVGQPWGSTLSHPFGDGKLTGAISRSSFVGACSRWWRACSSSD